MADVQYSRQNDSPNDPSNDELEPDSLDNDSALDVPLESLASLTSSILAYQEENGRTYHAKSIGKYMLPNDEVELDRLDMMHHLFMLTFGGHQCLCPKEAGAKRVLDIGTGTGIWAIEYADEHPEAEVIGVDVSPTQAPYVPPNCSFEIDDIEQEWTWTTPFDFIFCRSMTGTLQNWESVIDQAYQQLEPGGYLELQDAMFPIRCDDDTMPEGTPLLKWTQLLVEASDKIGRPLSVARRFKGMLEAAGFVDVVEKQYKWPSNKWPRDKKFKDIGLWTLSCLDNGVEGLSLALFTRGLGWTKEETLLLCSQVRSDFRNPRIHGYFDVHVAYGRKPMNS